MMEQLEFIDNLCSDNYRKCLKELDIGSLKLSPESDYGSRAIELVAQQHICDLAENDSTRQTQIFKLTMPSATQITTDEYAYILGVF